MIGLKIRIIPCLDVKLGFVVKGIKFSELFEIGNPMLISNNYSLNGADELCFLDVSASSSNKNILYKIISNIAENCFIPLTVGGGIRKINDVKNLLIAGADKISINSAAIFKPEFIGSCVDKFGSQCIIVSIDCKVNNNRWEIYSHGGKRSTGIDALEYAYIVTQYGAGEVLITSIDNDGSKNGYDIALLKAMSKIISIPIIASGGAGKLKHLITSVKEGEISAILLASLLHYDKYSITQIKFLLGKCGILVRDDYIKLGLYDE